MQRATKPDARIYGPIVTACVEGARERAIDLVLNAAEGLVLEAPERFPMLADAIAECKGRLMVLALAGSPQAYLAITQTLGLAQQIPTFNCGEARMSLR